MKTAIGDYRIADKTASMTLSVLDENGNLRERIIVTGSGAPGGLLVGESAEQPSQRTIREALGGKGAGASVIKKFDVVKTGAVSGIVPGASDPSMTAKNPAIVTNTTISVSHGTDEGQQSEQVTRLETVQGLIRQADGLGVNTGFSQDFLETKLKDATEEELQDLQSISQRIVHLARMKQSVEPGMESGIKPGMEPGMEQDGGSRSNRNDTISCLKRSEKKRNRSKPEQSSPNRDPRCF